MTSRTPDVVMSEIHGYKNALVNRAPQELEAAELKSERAADAAQLAQDKALLNAEGSIPEKQAQARLASADLRDEAFIAHAELTRVKARVKGLESGLMSLQSELKHMREEGA